MLTKNIWPIFALALTVLFFSGIELVSKTITYDINPVQINFLRFIAAGFMLLPFSLRNLVKARKVVTIPDWINISILGIINVSISVTLLHITVMLINASLAAVLFCTNPIFANIFESLFNRTKLNLITIISLLVSFLGIAVISISELIHLQSSPLGIATGLLSSITYGFFIVYAKRISSHVDNLTINCFSFIIGAIFLIPVLVAINSPIFSFDFKLLPQLLYLTLFATVGAYLLFIYSLQHLPAGLSSLIFFIKPPLAIFLAYLFLDEIITTELLIGTGLILGGIGLYTLNKLPPVKN